MNIFTQFESIFEAYKMRQLKHSLFLTLLFCLVYAFASAQIRVACIGNSITAGSGLDTRTSEPYPKQLQILLGSGYEVKNYGISGTTMLKDLSDGPSKEEQWSYWEPYIDRDRVGGLEKFQEALAWEPHIVIIKFGTNDARAANWPSQEEDGRNNFHKTYVEFINTFKALTTNPTIYICYPIPFFKSQSGSEREQARVIREEVIPLVKQVALHTDVKLIDLHSIFKNVIEDDNHIFTYYQTDRVHPNPTGAALIAQEVYKAIMMNK